MRCMQHPTPVLGAPALSRTTPAHAPRITVARPSRLSSARILAAASPKPAAPSTPPTPAPLATNGAVSSKKKVVVVGAGWAGFGAAKHLTEQGYAVTLLDASPNPGGLSAGWRTPQGRAVEAGFKGFWYQVRLLIEKHARLPNTNFHIYVPPPSHSTSMPTYSAWFVNWASNGPLPPLRPAASGPLQASPLRPRCFRQRSACQPCSGSLSGPRSCSGPSVRGSCMIAQEPAIRCPNTATTPVRLRYSRPVDHVQHALPCDRL